MSMNRPLSEDHKNKISKALTGIKRNSFSLEHRLKLSEARKKNNIVGDKHPMWKGKDASYRAIHQWVTRQFGKPDICEICKKGNLSGHKIHWANKSGKYKRKRDDWERICPKCHHKKYTGKLLRKTL